MPRSRKSEDPISAAMLKKQHEAPTSVDSLRIPDHLDPLAMLNTQDDPTPVAMPRFPGDPIPVAIYARVSSDRQDINNSIQAQIAECTEYARAHNMVVVEIYIDEATSGRISSRPEFQRMISDGTGQERKFATVLVWKLSRFSRNILDSVVYQAMLEKRGVELISITEPIDDSPAGRLVRDVIRAIDAFHSENLSEDVRRGLRSLVMRKFYPGNKASFGLKLEKVKEEGGEAYHYRLVLNPPYDQIVRRIFLEVIAGRSDTDIQKGLFEDKIPSPRGKEKWPTSTIDTMVKKKVYAGYIVWGLNSEHGYEPLEVPDCHPAIVSPEEWEMAQRSRASRRKSTTHPRQAGSERTLSGMLKCRNCGENLHVQPSKSDRFYYVCGTKRRGRAADCICPNVNVEDEQAILNAVTEDVLSPGNMATAIEAIARELKAPYEERAAALDLIDRELKKIERRDDKVKTSWEDNVYTLEEYNRRMAPLRRREAELREKRAQADQELDRDARVVADPQSVIAFAQDVAGLIQHSTAKEMRESLKGFIKCIWIEPGQRKKQGKATIIYRIPLPGDGPNPGALGREVAIGTERRLLVSPTTHHGPYSRGSTLSIPPRRTAPSPRPHRRGTLDNLFVPLDTKTRPLRPGMNPYWLSALQTKPVARQFHIEAKGATRYGLTHNSIRSVFIPFAPTDEHTPIADCVDRVSTNIAAAVGWTRRQIELLEEHQTKLLVDVVTRNIDIREVEPCTGNRIQNQTTLHPALLIQNRRQVITEATLE